MRKKKFLVIALVVITVVWAVALYLHVQEFLEATRKGYDPLLFTGPFSLSAIVIVASWLTLAWKRFRHQSLEGVSSRTKRKTRYVLHARENGEAQRYSFGGVSAA